MKFQVGDIIRNHSKIWANNIPGTFYFIIDIGLRFKIDRLDSSGACYLTNLQDAPHYCFNNTLDRTHKKDTTDFFGMAFLEEYFELESDFLNRKKEAAIPINFSRINLIIND